MTSLCDESSREITEFGARVQYIEGTQDAINRLNKDYQVNIKVSAKSILPPGQNLGVHANDFTICKYDPYTGKGKLHYYPVLEVKG